MKTKPCHCCDGSGTELDQRELGRDLRKLRISKNISQSHVSKRMGISGSYLSDLELGNRCWSDELITKFRKAVIGRDA